MKYIPADKLIAQIKELRSESCISESDDYYEYAKSEILDIITSLQQEQPKDKQIIIITESHGDANIEWDCRSLDDVIALLESAESFITDKQIEKLRGKGSGPDYNTTEGRFRNARKFQQEQPEVDLKKEIECSIRFLNGHHTLENEERWYKGRYEELRNFARHFYELGARKEE